MTPFEISVLMHYHERNDNYPALDDDKMLLGRTLIELGAQELIYLTNDGYRATNRLHTYCQALEMVPLPTHKWVVERPLGDPATYGVNTMHRVGTAERKAEQDEKNRDMAQWVDKTPMMPPYSPNRIVDEEKK